MSSADAAGDAEPAAAISKALRELCIDNSAVTVWRTIIEPNNELKMHRHERARVVVAIRGGSLRKVTDSGEESMLTFDTGKAYWLESDPPFELHRSGRGACEVDSRGGGGRFRLRIWASRNYGYWLSADLPRPGSFATRTADARIL